MTLSTGSLYFCIHAPPKPVGRNKAIIQRTTTRTHRYWHYQNSPVHLRASLALLICRSMWKVVDTADTCRYECMKTQQCGLRFPKHPGFGSFTRRYAWKVIRHAGASYIARACRLNTVTSFLSACQTARQSSMRGRMPGTRKYINARPAGQISDSSAVFRKFFLFFSACLHSTTLIPLPLSKLP